ncbi:MAG: DUF3833 domain-containing protein [Inquilinaceae bacterium]
MMLRIPLLLLLALSVLWGCSTMKPEDFADTEPRFIVEDYFDGKVRAWGLFEDRFGNVRRQFTVDIEGVWDGRELTLVEDFLYDDGATERRIWRIEKIDDNTYRGRADDVVGEAVGRSYGNALKWDYNFDLAIGDRTWRVHFDDWMLLQADGVMINRAKVTKWGIELGEANIFFRRVDGQDQAAQPARALQTAP